MAAPDSRWKEAYALTEDLRLMVLLDLEALSRMRPESLLKDCLNILVRHGLCESFWGGQSWQIDMPTSLAFAPLSDMRNADTRSLVQSTDLIGFGRKAVLKSKMAAGRREA